MKEIRLLLDETITIPCDEKEVMGSLKVPPSAKALIIFAHGSGSGRFSSRNQAVANFLNQAGFATLLFDLLTNDEEVIDEKTREYRFNIPLLAERLERVTLWTSQHPELTQLPVGYFGASTGAGAALLAAANIDDLLKTKIFAIVSRGGRPDLAGAALENVQAPTLLIIGGNDIPVIELNENILPLLHCKKEMVIISHATHLFEEPGKLEEVMQLTLDWFKENLPA